MDLQEIEIKLKENHRSFIRFNLGLEESYFIYKINDKWSAGEQLEHVYLSIKSLNFALGLPKFLLKLFFGKAKRKRLNYEELVLKYQARLKNGAKSSKKYFPKSIDFNERKKQTIQLSEEIELISEKLKVFSENELDVIRLPHPILGKISLREIMFFTIYHVEHHLYSIKANLKAIK